MVRIAKSEVPRITVKPAGKEVVKGWLEEFAQYAVDKARNKKSTHAGKLSDEAERALLNMTGFSLDSVRHQSSSSPEPMRNLISEATELIAKHSRVEKDTHDVENDAGEEDSDPAVTALVKILETAARQDSRTRTVFEFNSSSEWRDQAFWLQETFRKINVMLEDDVPFPESIEIGVPQNEIELLSKFMEIIDTKGLVNQSGLLDTNTERLLLDPATISIFCTPYESAPEPSIRSTLKYYLSQDPENRKDQFLLMAVPKNSKAPQMQLGQDGYQVDDMDLGCQIKLDQIQRDLEQNHINLTIQKEYKNGARPHLFIYDAKRYLRSADVPVRTIVAGSNGRRHSLSQSIWEADRNYGNYDVAISKNSTYSQEVLVEIGHCIERRRERLIHEVEKTRQSARNINSLPLLSEGAERGVRFLVEDIVNLSRPTPDYKNHFANLKFNKEPYLAID